MHIIHFFNSYSSATDCFWMLSAILEYTAYNNLVQLFSNQDKVFLSPMDLPNRMEGMYTDHSVPSIGNCRVFFIMNYFNCRIL